MTSVFISYSRKDTDFVRQLHESLGASDHQTWVDWEGIPPTAEWMKEIVAAIDAASAFVFVMTPDSLISRVCLEELTHAASQNKRLIPVVRRDVDFASVPESLARMNWIFLRDTDDFPATFRTLVTAIDTDLDWVSAHTRLLVRAREWDTKGRENSLALRGKDLKAAEQWLTLAPTRQPQPTELQTLYILRSRKVATNRRYALLGAAIIGMVAVAILGTTTYIGRKEAARQQTVALAGRLTADAELARDQPEEENPSAIGWLERSVLLATEATAQLNSIGMRSVQTDIALRRGLALLPRRVKVFSRTDDPKMVDEMVWAEDGRLITAAKSSFLTVEQFGVDGQRLNWKQSDERIEKLTFSPDGMFIATTNSDGGRRLVDILETTTLDRVASFSGIDATLTAFALSSAAKYLAVSSQRFNRERNEYIPGQTRVWAARKAGYVELVRLPHASSLTFSVDGNWLAGIVDSVPRAWRLMQGPDVGLQEVSLTEVGSNALGVRFSADGELLVATFEHGDMKIWNLAEMRLVRELNSPDAPRAISADGRYAAVYSGDYYTLKIIETERGGEVARMHSAGLIEAVAFRADSQRIAVGGLSETIELWQVDESGSDIRPIDAGREIRAAIFSPDETSLMAIDAAADKLQLRSWPLNERDSSSAVTDLQGDVMTFSADGRFVAAAKDQTATLYSATDGRTTLAVQYPGSATAIALNSEGSHMAVASDSGVLSLWQVGTKRAPLQFSVRGRVAQGFLAVGSSGKTLVAVAAEAATRKGETLVTYFWQPPQVVPAAEYPVGTDRSGLTAAPCALSADARYLMADEGGGTMVMRETPTGHAVGSIGHPGSENVCGFSADSRLVATSGGSVLRVWEVSTQEEMARIEQAADVRDLVFSPRGRYLATIGSTNLSRVWLLDPADLIAAACARVTQNLSRKERSAYFGDAPYAATCPNAAIPKTEDSVGN